jgi:hypothetical protein
MSASTERNKNTIIAFVACAVFIGIYGTYLSNELLQPINELEAAKTLGSDARNDALQGVIQASTIAAFWAALGVAFGALLSFPGGRLEAIGKGLNAAAALFIVFATGLIIQASGLIT